MTTATVTDSARQQYETDGYLSPIDLFSADEIDAYREQFDELEAREGKETTQIGLQARHFDQEFIWKLAADPRVLDWMEGVMGEDLLLLSTHFFCKYPDAKGEKFVAWHQDVTYWGLEPDEAHTAWIAIDDSDVENGCMQVIPGSHTEGIVPHGKSDRGGNLLSINQEIPDEYVDKTNAVNLELESRPDVDPLRQGVSRQPSQHLEPEALRPDGPLHSPRGAPDRDQLAGRQLEAGPDARRGPLPPLSRNAAPVSGSLVVPFTELPCLVRQPPDRPSVRVDCGLTGC